MVEESPVICAGLARVGGVPRDVFLELKGGVEGLLDQLGVSSPIFREKACELYTPGERVGVFSGETPVGVVGLIREDLCHAFDVDVEAWVAELDLRSLAGLWRPLGRMQSFSNFPSVVRDLAIVVDEQVSCEWLQAQILSRQVPHLEEIEPYDEYRGRQVAGGKKSIALRLTFSHPDKTLTEEEVHQALAQLVDALKSKGASLREADSGIYEGDGSARASRRPREVIAAREPDE